MEKIPRLATNEQEAYFVWKIETAHDRGQRYLLKVAYGFVRRPVIHNSGTSAADEEPLGGP